MIPAALLLKFPILGKLPWKLIGYGAALLVIVGGFLWYRHSLIERGRTEGEAAAKAAYEAGGRAATERHNANIKRIDTAHAKALTDLAKERDAALARPATRTIRVPVSAVCPRTIPGDAGLPAGANPAGEHVDVPDPGYGELRAWLINYAAGPDHGR